MSKSDLPNIAVVFFTNMTQGLKAKVSVVDDRPYMYLNNLDLEEGDYALVHVSQPSRSTTEARYYNPYRVVQIGRIVPLDTPKAAERIHQPLIAEVVMDEKRIRSDYKAIKKASSMIDSARRQSIIDDALGIDRSKEAPGLNLTDETSE